MYSSIITTTKKTQQTKFFKKGTEKRPKTTFEFGKKGITGQTGYCVDTLICKLDKILDQVKEFEEKYIYFFFFAINQEKKL